MAAWRVPAGALGGGRLSRAALVQGGHIEASEGCEMPATAYLP